jgi:hypothetical protein
MRDAGAPVFGMLKEAIGAHDQIIPRKVLEIF